VTRRRERPQATYRDRSADRLTAFRALLASVPPTPALLARLIRDRGVCAGGVSYRKLHNDFASVWEIPDEHMDSARDVAELFSRNGAAWGVVLPVLIAENDHDLEQHVPGWRGWREMTDAHEAIRDVFTNMRLAYEWSPGELEAALDGLLYHLGGDTSNLWDGYSPRSTDEYAARPGDFHPGIALALVDEMRRDFDHDDNGEARLALIECAAYSALGHPLSDAPREATESESVAESARRGLASLGGVSEKHWQFIESSGRVEDASDDGNSEGRASELADADRVVAAVLPNLPSGQRAVAETMIALSAQGIKPTAPAIAKAMGKERTPAVTAAIRQAKRRMAERIRSLPESTHR
jgi:hypothetical protein